MSTRKKERSKERKKGRVPYIAIDKASILKLGGEIEDAYRGGWHITKELRGNKYYYYGVRRDGEFVVRIYLGKA